ncbi:DUF6978 family protein [Tetragenococcus halophilus]|uniref:DUF6978 family protein n=1 Tax=Tetragenococcus halophilus TaxID=51669 RepID=UPI0015BC66CD|nr:hypothetical protein [Tetragenococcus halophilus]NWO00825.1 hypothetical protein [Tetragenococcus halophilus]GFK24924.1 hypothetical protein YA163_19870 [Tetragenococcus halophilus]
MEDKKYNELLELIKLLRKNTIEFPDNGKQNSYKLTAKDNISLTFELLINRKGHLRENVLTFLMKSENDGIMVRLDMTGPPHASKEGVLLDTPHVHIFNEKYNEGKWAVSLSDIDDENIIYKLHDGLNVFLKYNNVETKNVSIPFI